jgi:hypothetical protein
MVCSLAGHERTPRSGRHRIERPFPHASLVYDRCPWGTILRDPFIARAMNAHGIASRPWGAAFPVPGRPDPRLMEAFAVISSEHDRIDLERLEEPRKRVGAPS